MLCIGKNQPTEEFPVEANEAFQDAEDRGESAERVNWNQVQQNGRNVVSHLTDVFGNQTGTVQHCVSVAQPEKKTPEVTFII